MGKIGLFGGTFDPIHMGHIALAKRVLEQFELDSIIFIPAGNPPHKSAKTITDKQHRYNMVKLATENEPSFLVSDFEILSSQPNYSYITISHFKQQYAGDEIFFIVGGDSFRDFPDWKNYKTLLSLCTFIVVPRPEIAPSQYFEKFSGDETPPRVFFIENFSFPVSSTNIRKSLQKGMDVSLQLPPFVAEYIKTNKLYL